MSDPLISVIVLTYRSFDAVFLTIDSILEQTYPNIEIVLSDDGSPNYADYEGKIQRYIEAGRHGHITNVVYNHLTENRGTVCNCNHALRMAGGRYIKILGCGDQLLDEHSLETYCREMQRRGARLLTAQAMPYIPSTMEQRAPIPAHRKLRAFDAMTARQQFSALLEQNHAVNAISVFLDASLFEQFGLFDERFRYIEDYPYWLHLTDQRVRFEVVHRPLVKYALTGMSNSAGKSEFQEIFLDEKKRMYLQMLEDYVGGTLREKLLAHIFCREQSYQNRLGTGVSALYKRTLQLQYPDFALFYLYRHIKIAFYSLKYNLKGLFH